MIASKFGIGQQVISEWSWISTRFIRSLNRRLMSWR